ncbi:MAG: His/Gly/Thr/Pro-type tRNA ligase C-terminal domain-containing protein, partial [Cytophagales bacterium]
LTEGYTQTAERTYLKFPPPLAPIQAAILPLLKKEPLITKARSIFQSLRHQFRLTYDDTGSIGKRYTRQDLIGTPYAITVDFQTLADDMVTVREIISTQQVRIPTAGLANYLSDHVDMQHLLQPPSP